MGLLNDPDSYPCPSRRGLIFGRHGMVCASQPLAAQAGLRMLQAGGNAVDAALAAAICLTVVEPTSNGLGSDAFALVWTKGKLYGLNGSGYAPSLLSLSALAAKGIKDKLPQRGWETVTVPGAPSAWQTLHRRFGRLPFARLFEPAVDYAEGGYPLTPVIAALYKKAWDTFAPYRGREEFAPFFATFFPQGRAPKTGEEVKLPFHGQTLRELAATYCESYYRGPLARALLDFSRKTGGYLEEKDLADYGAEWVEPLSLNYRGYDVWELPPNGHGITALIALAILAGFDFDEKERNSPLTWHRQIEAMKLAFADTMFYVTDPRYMRGRAEALLDPAYIKERRSLIVEMALSPAPGDPFGGGTVYLNAADDEGNMVSFIQSNYMGFGSGITVPGTGIALNNRALGFSMDPRRDGCLAPGKKPYHTIIPGFLSKDGAPVGPFGVMGGYMQPQGHVQVVMNMIDHGLNPQAALDALRWQWIGEKRVQVEPGTDRRLIEELRRRGHEVTIGQSIDFGRGQIILRLPNGLLCGATEPRADGAAAAW